MFCSCLLPSLSVSINESGKNFGKNFYLLGIYMNISVLVFNFPYFSLTNIIVFFVSLALFDNKKNVRKDQPNSMISVRTSRIFNPAASTCCGMKLVAVMPGVVFTSSNTGRPFSRM